MKEALVITAIVVASFVGFFIGFSAGKNSATVTPVAAERWSSWSSPFKNGMGIEVQYRTNLDSGEIQDRSIQ